MAKTIRFGVAALAAVVVLGATMAVRAQEAKPAQAAEVARKQAQIPLKLQLVLSRYQGDKKISSVPYQMWVTTNEAPTRLRMGLQIAVPMSVGAPAVTSSYSLKEVGTNIDCTATPGIDTGLYRISLTVNDSSIYNASPQRAASETLVPGVPATRNFTSTFTILLRDGQTAQYTSATDPVSGEVLKIDATLNVLK